MTAPVGRCADWHDTGGATGTQEGVGGMIADDPRHGSVTGYNRIPCRETCCKRAMATYKARWAWDRLNGKRRIISSVGSQRRIEALAWLGWSRQALAERLEVQAANVSQWMRNDTITADLAARIALLYDDLCMTVPTGNPQAIANVRNQARARGARPPLAWDDIDDPDERPSCGVRSDWGRPRDDIDEVVVERLLALQRVDSTRAEKEEAMRRWTEAGKSIKALCDAHGWRHGRYAPKRQEDAA